MNVVCEDEDCRNCKADKLLNSKSEREQPAVDVQQLEQLERLIVTRELPEHDERRGGGARGRG